MQNHFKTNQPGMKKRLILGLLAVGILGFAIQSCTKDYFDFDKMKDPDWTPEYALPIGHARIEVEDFLDRFNDDSIVKIGPDSLLVLQYFRDIFTQNIEGKITLGDQNGIPAPYVIDANDAANYDPISNGLVSSRSVNAPFGVNNGEQLSSIEFKAGVLTLTYQNTISAPCGSTISIPNLVDGNGTPFSRTVTPPAPANMSQPSLFPGGPVDLTGYTLLLNQGPNGFNDLNVMVSVQVQTGGLANIGEAFRWTIDINGMQWSTLNGTFPNLAIQLPEPPLLDEKVRMRIFENSISGDVHYEDPKLIAFFENTFGLGVNVTFNKLQAQPSAGGSPVNITANPGGIGSGLTITIPKSTTPGQPSFSAFGDSAANSNIPTIIDLEPTHIIYNSTVSSAPGGVGTDFITDQSYLKLSVLAELPFHGTAQDFTTADTFSFAVPDSATIAQNDQSYIKQIVIRLVIDNGFPAEGYVQADFGVYDSISGNITPITTLFEGQTNKQIFASGKLTGDHVEIPSGVVQSIVDIPITREKLEMLRDAKVDRMVLKTELDTYNNGQQVVKVFADSYILLHVGLRVEVAPFEAANP